MRDHRRSFTDEEQRRVHSRVDRERRRRTVPAVGLLIQDVDRFWNTLWRAIPEPDGRMIRVKRSGPWNRRNFTFEDMGTAIAVDGVPIPDLDAYLDEIGSVKRLRDLVGSQHEHSTLRGYP